MKNNRIKLIYTYYYAEFSLTEVEDNAIDVLPRFNWEAATDADGDTVTYYLYWGTEENLTTVLEENIENTFYWLCGEEALSKGTKYYWKIIAKDSHGDSRESETFSFTTVTNTRFPKTSRHTSVIFDNKIWVIAGYPSVGAWYSADGLNWTQTIGGNDDPADDRNGHTSVVFKGKMWIIGGDNKNDVWYSEDGITWTEATNDASWERRSGTTSLVFNNKMWLIGGQDYDSKNDVWSSTDGIIWTEAIGVAPSSEKTSSSSVVFNNKMWIIGRSGQHGYGQNDVWMSTDGANWVESK